MDEEKTESTEEKPKGTVAPNDDGVKQETTPSLKEREETARREKELLDLEEFNKTRKENAGKAEAGSVPPKPKVLTDEEYSTAYDKGEVDPFSGQ